ncbi:MAG TPA: glycosyltransferase [Stellaceae bacterium]|jgi:glycosyltransferase involved in cell wall biosynthesis|nr:glycosyltransferase [Stellaceae bacterium]
MAPQHIVVIPSWYSDGRGSGGGYFRDQALALQSAGHRVAILAPDIYTARDLRRGGPLPQQRTGVQHDGIDTYRRGRRVVMPRLPYRNALSWSLCGLRLFAEYVARNGMPDLVHAHSCLNAGVLAALIAARHGVPFVVTEHSTGFGQNRLRWWERDLVRRVARRARHRIAVSPYLARLLEQQFPGTDWTYVPNILGEPFLAESGEEARVSGSRRPFIFICAARLSPVKNHALLLAAFADAFVGEPEVLLHFAGNGPLQSQLHQVCLDRGISEQVTFLGTLPAEELRAAMQAADAFVLASDHETFGVVVIEAQAAGLPVICTASGGPDHLVDATNGLSIPTNNRTALRDALSAMRHNAATYDRAKIRNDAIRLYGPAAFIRQFETIIGR